MAFVEVDRSLPRSLDVQISLSRASTETRTDLSILAFCATGLGFLPDANRVRFYSTIEAVENDFNPGSEAHFAATYFFAQSPRPATMAIGEVFLDPIAAENISATFTQEDIDAIIDVINGTMTLNYVVGGVVEDKTILPMNFGSAVNLVGIAAVIDGAVSTEFGCEVRTLPGGDEVLSITTTLTGDGNGMLFPTDEGGVNWVGDLLKLTLETGGKVADGYTPLGIADELTSVANAANAAGKFIYGWTLSESLRLVAGVQEEAAAWALPRTAVMVLTTNDLTALDPGVDTDLGSVIAATDNRKVVVLYHDNAQRYPDVSILAYMLHVNYRLQDSTVTAKFKQLPGIETVQLSETEWSVLQSKGYNTYTAIGNDSRTYRDGITSGLVGWYMDTVINLDNFLEDLSVNVFNVFLRNKKIPYTRNGQMLLVDACQDTGNQYVYNGTFADRLEASTETKSGNTLIPAVQVIPTPVEQASAADRVAREGPPIQMIVQETGAIHSTSINVELVQ